MQLSPLQTKLLPTVEEMSVREVAASLKHLNVDFVEKHICGVERFNGRILEAELKKHGVVLSDQSLPFDKEHVIQAILPLSQESAFVGLGLCWNANRLAYSAFRNKSDNVPKLNGYSANDVRFALKFRSAQCVTAEGLPSRSSVTADGLLCFACWLSDVPKEMQQLIDYHLSAHGHKLPKTDALTPTEKDERIKVCSQWCEQKIAATAAQEDEATDAG